MTFTNEQLKQLAPEQLDEYNKGIDDCCNNQPFNPDWSEARKEGYRDAADEMENILVHLLLNVQKKQLFISRFGRLCEQSTSE